MANSPRDGVRYATPKRKVRTKGDTFHFLNGISFHSFRPITSTTIFYLLLDFFSELKLLSDVLVPRLAFAEHIL